MSVDLPQEIIIETIFGKAGCGKSTRLSEHILKNHAHNIQHPDRKHSFVVLASTNSAVENIFQICFSKDPTIKRSKFKTIYSYFRIDWVNNNVLGPIDLAEVIYFDEFSLMNKHLFKKCLDRIAGKNCAKMVLCGDILQLNAVYKEQQTISFDEIRHWNRLFSDMRTKLKIIQERHAANEDCSPEIIAGLVKQAKHGITNKYVHAALNTEVLEHIFLNVFSLREIQEGTLIHLQQNRRSNDAVKTIINSVYSKQFDQTEYAFIPFTALCDVISNEHYTFIASKYTILQQVYDSVYENNWSKNASMDVIFIEQKVSLTNGFKQLYLYADMPIIVSETDMLNKKYINGEELIFTGQFTNLIGMDNPDVKVSLADTVHLLTEASEMVCIRPTTNERVLIKRVYETYVKDGVVHTGTNQFYYPIMPAFLMSFHKSQGRTIDNVIICVDDIFDITMLYTGMTRARNNLKFFSSEQTEEKRKLALKKASFVHEFTELNIFSAYLTES